MKNEVLKAIARDFPNWDIETCESLFHNLQRVCKWFDITMEQLHALVAIFTWEEEE